MAGELYGDAPPFDNEQNEEALFAGEGLEELAEEVKDLTISEPVCSRVEVAMVFSPILFLGEDLYQRKKVRMMIYRFDDSYFIPMDIEDLTLDLIVLIVDDDGVDFQRALVSKITRTAVSVDLMDFFGVKEVSTVYECPEEIQEERAALRKFSLKKPPSCNVLLKGQKLNLLCDPSEKDYVEAEVIE